MIELTKEFYLGRGRTRECFIDPRHPLRCIKIDFRDQGFRQTEKEALYYRKLAKLKPDFSYDFIPRFHGMVTTDRGEGGVFDLITDEGTNRVSRMMRDFIDDGSLARETELWENVISHFRSRLLETGVIVRDLRPANLCVRKKLGGTYELVAIDGIGHRDFVPLCDYFPAFARRKLRRLIAHKHLTSVRDLLEWDQREAERRAARVSP
ncbi:MAG: YrbL family protein [Luteolibacter sp.]